MALDYSPTFQETPATTITTGRKVIAAAGTAERLTAASTAARLVVITAETDNTGVIVVGGASVVATQATRQGTPLTAGATITIPIDDLYKIYLDTTVNGDGVTYTSLV